MFTTKRKVHEFADVLKKAIDCAEDEREKAQEGRSIWGEHLITNVVLPELKELFEYAQEGKAFFKYGRWHRRLQSAYFMTDRMENLYETDLGKCIVEVEKKYERL